MSQTPNIPLETAGSFLTELLTKGTIVDGLSEKPIPVPIDGVEIRTETVRSGEGDYTTKEYLHVVIKGKAEAELNQAAVIEQAEETLRNIPSLAEHFNFSGETEEGKSNMEAHNWRDDRNLDLKFLLPAGISPAQVVREILNMAKGAELTKEKPAELPDAEVPTTTEYTPAEPVPTAEAAPAPATPQKTTEKSQVSVTGAQAETTTNVPDAAVSHISTVPVHNPAAPLTTAGSIAAKGPTSPLDHAARQQTEIAR